MNLIPAGVSESELAQAKAQATPAAAPVDEYRGPYWKTKLINEHPDEAVKVWSGTGRVLMVIEPKREITICIWDPTNLYAPFERVVWAKNGTISTTRRGNFEDPAGQAPYVLLLDNRDGSESESIKIGDQYIEAIRGIPRRVAVDIRVDPLAPIKAVRWIKRTIKTPAPGNKNYLITRTIVEKVLVPRKKSEIKAIKELIEDEALAQARRTAEERFGGIEGGPEVEDEPEVQGPDAEG